MNFNGGSGFGGSGSLGPTVIDGDLTVNDRILMSDGLVAAPSLAYSAEPTTGWTRTASGEARFVVSGASKVVLNSSGVSAANGTFGVSMTTPTASVGTLAATTATLTTATIPTLTSSDATFTNSTSTTMVATTQPLIRRDVTFSLTGSADINFSTAQESRGSGLTFANPLVTVASNGYYSVDVIAQVVTSGVGGSNYVTLQLSMGGVATVSRVPTVSLAVSYLAVHYKCYLAAGNSFKATVDCSDAGARSCYSSITVVKDS